MIHCDHVNAFHKKGLNYHTINHTILRVNGLIVTQNLYFQMDLITTVILEQKKCEEYSILEYSWGLGTSPVVKQ